MRTVHLVMIEILWCMEAMICSDPEEVENGRG